MTEFPLSPFPSAAEVDRNAQRRRLRSLLIAAAVVWGLIGLSQTSVSDVGVAGAAPQSTEAEFHAWYSASPRNAAYYHVRQHFGTGALGDKAIRVALCESDLQPRAVSPTGDHGVLQLNAKYQRAQFERVTGVAWSPNVYHADANARYARWLYEQSGWQPWTCAR